MTAKKSVVMNKYGNTWIICSTYALIVNFKAWDTISLHRQVALVLHPLVLYFSLLYGPLPNLHNFLIFNLSFSVEHPFARHALNVNLCQSLYTHFQFRLTICGFCLYLAVLYPFWSSATSKADLYTTPQMPQWHTQSRNKKLRQWQIVQCWVQP